MTWAPGSRVPRILVAGSSLVWLVAAAIELHHPKFEAMLYLAAGVLLAVFAAAGTPRRAAAYAAGVAGAWRIWDLVVAFRDGLIGNRVGDEALAWFMFTVYTVLLVSLNWRIANEIVRQANGDG